MTRFWNLAQGVIFQVLQLGKIWDAEEFLLLWNDHPSFLGEFQVLYQKNQEWSLDINFLMAAYDRA